MQLISLKKLNNRFTEHRSRDALARMQQRLEALQSASFLHQPVFAPLAPVDMVDFNDKCTRLEDRMSQLMSFVRKKS